MEKNGIFIFLTKENIEDGYLTIYSFLKHNIWFIGDIIISHIDGDIDEKTKYKFIQMYNQTVFLDIDINNYM